MRPVIGGDLFSAQTSRGLNHNGGKLCLGLPLLSHGMADLDVLGGVKGVRDYINRFGFLAQEKERAGRVRTG